MAISIKPTPILRGKIAEVFEKKASENLLKVEENIDFVKLLESTRYILNKSKLL